MGADRVEFNKLLQIYSLCSKLYSLVQGCYYWDKKAKQYMPVKNFTEQFAVVIKTVEDLKRHRAFQFLMEQIENLEVPSKERR